MFGLILGVKTLVRKFRNLPFGTKIVSISLLGFFVLGLVVTKTIDSPKKTYVSSPPKTEVLATTARALQGSFNVNVPAYFNDFVNIRNDFQVDGTTTLNGDVFIQGERLEITSDVIAPNLVYSATAGDGIAITGTQDLTIENTGVTSFQGQTGEVTLTAGDNVTISGTTISATVPSADRFNTVSDGTNSFSASGNDTVTFLAGTGIALSTNTTEKEITITSTVTGNVTGVGDGLALSSGIASVALLSAQSGTGSTSSFSGLEFVGASDQLTLLQGCGNGELLKFNTGTNVWECSSDDGGVSGIIVVEEDNVQVSASAGTLDFLGSDFTLSESPVGEINVSIDYANSEITRNNQNETIVGDWTLSGAVIFDSLSSGTGTSLCVDGSDNLITCTVGTGVTSLNSLSGALTIANATTGGSTITINDASTAQKGIAQFSSTNFTAASGTINTIQNINTGASPTFTGLTLSGLNSNGIVHTNGTGVLSTSALDLEGGASYVTGQLPAANGGTGIDSSGDTGVPSVSGGTWSISSTLATSLGGLGADVSAVGGGEILYSVNASTYDSLAAGNSGDCLISGGTGAPSWTDCAGATGITTYWDLTSGALTPKNATVDFLVGGTATSTASFAIIGVSDDTPVASISAVGSGLGLYLSYDGTIQTTLNQTLTLGGSTTGNILLSPSTGRINADGTLNLTSGNTYQINSVDVLSATTLGANVVTSSLTTVGTIGTGVWQGTAISSQYGGTGQNFSGATGVPYINGGTWSTEAELSPSRGGTGQDFSGDTGVISVSGGTFSALSQLTTALGGLGADVSAVGGGEILYSVNASSYDSLAAGNDGECLVSGGTSAPSWTDCAGATGIVTYWDLTSGILNPKNSTVDLLVGGTSTSSAKFAITNINGARGTQTATLSGSLTLDSVGSIQTTNNQTLSIGGGTTGDISFGRVSQNIFLPAFASNDNSVLYTGTNGVLAAATTTSSGLCLVSNGSDSAPSWGACDGVASVNVWEVQLGSIVPGNETVDLLVGGRSTESAKFAFTGVATDSPVASISASGGQALSLGYDGTIETTLNQTLTLGGGTTGNIFLTPLAGGGSVNVSGELNLTSGNTFQINGVDVLSATTLGANVVTSSLTSVGTIGTGVWQGTAVGSQYGGTGQDFSGDTGVISVSGGTFSALSQLTTALGGLGADVSAVGGGEILYSVNASSYDSLAAGNSGECLISGGTGAPSWTDCAGATGIVTYWDLSSGVLNPKNSTVDFAIGGTSTTSAKFAIIGVNDDTPTATISATDGRGITLGYNGTLQTTLNQTLNIGGGSTGSISLGQAGKQIILPGYAGQNGILYAAQTTGLLTQATTSTPGECLISGASAPVWGPCDSPSSVNVWEILSGAIVPGNSTTDLLIGGTSTESAKFAVTGVSTDTPVATLSASGGEGLYLSYDGSIQTTQNRTLILGGDTTGEIVLSGFGAGAVQTDSAGVLSSGALSVLYGGLGADVSAVGGGEILYSVNASSYDSLAAGNNGECLVSGGTSAPSWTDCAGATGIVTYWDLVSGALTPKNTTLDLLVGGTTTSSARFAVIGVNDDTPVASISASDGRALMLGYDGTIQTTLNQPLTIGGVDTGNINFFNTSNYLTSAGALTLASTITANATNTINGVSINAGTITGGTWQGTAIASQYGGTGQNFSSATGVPYINSGNWSTEAELSAARGGTGQDFSGDTGVISVSGGTFSALSQLTTALGGLGADVSAVGGGEILYSVNASSYDSLAAGNSGECLVSGGTSAPSWTDCAGATGIVTYWDLVSGALTPKNETYDFLLGGTSTESAKFAILGISETRGNQTATLSGNLTLDSVGSIQTTQEQTLSIGNGTSGNLLLGRTGKDIIFGSSALSDCTALQTVNGIIGCGTDDGITSYDNFWQYNSSTGIVASGNLTTDLLLGGTSTQSAKFAFINNAGGIPTASISAGLAGGIYITADGTLSTTAYQDLNIGSSSNGNITLTPKGGAGLVTINGELNLASGNTFQINGVDVLSATTLGANVVTSSLTSVGTIGTGVWQGTAIASQYGGTGQNFSSATGVPYINSGTWNTEAQLAASRGGLGEDFSAQTGVVSVSGGDFSALSQLTTALGGLGADVSAVGGGEILYSVNASSYDSLAAGNSGECLVSGGTSAPSWTDCQGAIGEGASKWNIASGAISTIIPSLDLLLGGTTTDSAKFAFVNVASGMPTASISAGLDGALTISADGQIQTTANQSISIGSGDSGNIILGQSGRGIILPGFTGQNGILYGTQTTGLLSQATTSTSGLCLVSGASAPTWTDCAGAIGEGSSKWSISAGALSPIIPSLDLLLGGSTTSSARFAFIGVETDDPIASISASNGNALSLSNTGVIQTSMNQTLTLGGLATGDIFLSPSTGRINADGTLNLTSGNTYQIAGTDVLSATALGTNVVSSSLTSVGTLTTGVWTATAISSQYGGTGQNFSSTTGVPYINSGTWSTEAELSPSRGGTGQDFSGDTGVISVSGGTFSALSQLTTALGGLGADISAVGGGEILYSVNASSYDSLAAGNSGECLISGGTGTPSWTDCSTAANDDWNLVDGALSPRYATIVDFLLGGTSTESAKFAIIGIAEARGSQTASLSGNLVLDAESSIQTTLSQNLTLGGSTTGNILLNADGSNFVGIGTASPLSTLDVSGTARITNTSDANDYFTITSGNTETTLTRVTDGGTLGNVTINSAGTLTAANLVGSSLTVSAFSIDGGLVYTNGSGLFSQLATGTDGQCLIANTGAAPEWGPCDGSTSVNTFEFANGTIRTTNQTVDLLIGGVSTDSAKFAVTNMTGARGTQVASLSGSLVLDSIGSLQTTNNQTLTIGGTTTGEILFLPSGGGGRVAIDGSLDLSSGNTFQINGTDVLSSTTLGTSVVTSSLTTVGTIGTGVWQGTVIASQYGGTGQNFSGNTGVPYLTTGSWSTEAQLAPSRGGTGQDTSGVLDGQLLIGNDSSNGFTLATLTPGSGINITNGAGSITIDQTSEAISKFTQNDTLGILTPNNNTLDLLIGGATTESAKFAIINIANGAPTASLSASGDIATYLTATGVLGTTNSQTLTIGSTSTGDIVLDPGTGNIRLADLATCTSLETVNGLLTCGTDDGILTYDNFWQFDSSTGIIAQGNLTTDVLFGATSTESAKFAFLNIAGARGTQTASISGSILLDSAGSLQTTNDQTLTIGGDTTGEIRFLANNNSNGLFLRGGNAAIGNQDPQAALDVSSPSFLSAPVNKIIWGSIGTTMGTLGYDGSSANEIRIGATSDVGLQLITNDTVQAYISNAGNFGIGTSNPLAKLDVSGDASISGNLTFYGGARNIQSTLNQTLTIGGNSTGDIVISPRDGSGYLDLTATQRIFNVSDPTDYLSIVSGATETTFARVTDGGTLGNVTINSAGTLTAANLAASSLTIDAFTTDGGLLYTNGSGLFAQLGTGSNGQCLIANTGASPTWTTCPGGSGFTQWELANGAIYSGNTTLDFLLGGTSTDSAKFAVLNVAGGTPTASLSAGAAGGAYLTADGTLATTANQTLTLGGATTGNLSIPFDNIHGATITSDLSGGTRTTNVVTITQPNDATFGSGASSLLVLENLDSSSGGNILDIFGAGSSFTGASIDLNTGTALRLDAGNSGTLITSVSSGVSPITTGKIITFDVSFIASGKGIELNGSRSSGSLSAFTGDLLVFNPDRTYTGASTITDTGNFIDLSRVNTVNNASGTFAITGDLATFSSNCTETSGTCTDSSNILSLAQNYSSATGAVIELTNAGTGADIDFNSTSPTLTMDDGGTLTLTDGSNTLFSIADGGSAGNVNITGTLTAGGSITFSTFSTDGGLLYTNGSGVLAQLGTGSTGQCLLSNTGAAPTWGSCDGAGSVNTWEFGSGTIQTTNQTVDLLVGGTSTESAKFAVLGINDDTPIASISAIASGRGLSFGYDGTIQTTQNQTLTIGGNTTGNITLSALAGSGLITANGDLAISGGDLYLTGQSSSASTTEGTVYYDTDDDQLKVYANGKWQSDRTTATIIVGTSNSTTSSRNYEKADFVCGDSDCDTTIESAISALPAGGGAVVLLDGVYVIDSNGIDITGDNISLIGSGRGTVLQRGWNAGANDGVITISGATGVTIANLAVDGVKTTYTGTTNHGIYLVSSTTGSTIRNVYSHDNDGIGIRLDSSTYNLITGNSISSNDNTGLYMSSATNNTITNNTISSNGDRGMYLLGSSNNNSITGNYITGSTLQNILLDSDFNTVANNAINSGSSYGIYVSGVSNAITGNTIYEVGSTTDGIGVVGGDNNVISSNYIYDSTGSRYGIYVQGATAENNYIAANEISGAGFTADVNDLGTNTAIQQNDQFAVKTGIRSGNISGVSWTGATTANGAITSLDIDLTNLTANGSNGAYGLHINDFAATTASNEYGIYVEGTNYDYGLLVEDAVRFNSTLTLASLTTDGGLLYTNGSGVLAQLGTGTTGQCLLSNTGAAPTWGSCDGASSVNVWELADGTARTTNQTVDLLVGGTSTASAKFAVLNVNSGTPTASLSAGAAGGAYLTAAGTLQTTAGQTLTLGGTTTGNINIGTDATARALSLGNGIGASTLNFTSGTGAQTFTSSATSGTAFSFVGNSVTTGNALTLSGTAMTTGELLDLTGTWAPTDGSTNEAIDINITHAPTSSADSFSGIDFALTDATALGNSIVGIQNNITLTGNAAKFGTGYYGLVSSNSTTADTLTGASFTGSATGAISTGTRTIYGTFSRASSTGESTGGTTNLYGVYAQATGDVGAGGTINNYGVYVANGTYDTDGTSRAIGLYLEPILGADSNYGICLDCDGTWSSSTVASGIQFGTDANGVTLYRSANDTLRTDDDFVVGGGELYLAGISSSASTTEGTIYYDTDTDQLMVYANGKWQADRTTATVIVGTSNSTTPSDNYEKADFVCGNSDCDTTIESAISALPSTGGVVALLDGLYIIDSNGVDITKSNVSLIGAGRSTVLQRAWDTATDDGVITIGNGSTPYNGVTIADLAIDGVKATYTGTQNIGIYLNNNITYSTVRNTYAHDNDGPGIYLNTVTNNLIAQNDARSNDSVGIWVVTSHNNVVSSNNVQSNSGNGIHVMDGENNTVTGNNVQSNSEGIAISSGAESNTVISNIIQSNSIGISFTSAANNTVSGNTIDTSTQQGINMSFGDNNSVSANTITSSGTHGIQIDDSNGNSFSGNTINGVGASDDGILFTDTSLNNSITDNTITDTSGSRYGINVSETASSDNYLASNEISGAGFIQEINDAGTNTAIQQRDQFNIAGSSYGKALLSLNQTGDQDIFTASSAGTTRFRIDNSGNIIGAGTLTGLTGLTSSGTITFSGFSTDGGLLYTNGSGVLAQLGTGTTGQCLNATTGAAPTWGSCDGGASVNVWEVADGTARLTNSTVDLLAGGTSTSSARFAVLGINDDTPIASISAIASGSGLYLAYDGTIQTTLNQTLTLGGNTTGNIALSPRNGSGSVTVNGTLDAATGGTATVTVAASNTSSRAKAQADYVADGSGGTDDASTIESAIADLPSSGGIIVLLEGDYYLDSSIDITSSNVSLSGIGKQSRLIRGFNETTARTSGMITVGDGSSDYSRITITKLQLDGNDATHTDTDNYGILVESRVSNSQISDVYVHDNAGAGIYIGSSTTNTPSNISVLNNEASSNGLYGIYTYYNVDYSLYQGNTVTGNADGIYFEYGNNNNIVTNNIVYSNTENGIQLDQNSTEFSIANNQVVSNGSTGIFLGTGSANNSLANNLVDTNGANGIAVTGTGNQIIGNSVVSSTSDGVFIGINSERNLVSGNYIASNGESGVYLNQNANYTIISDNRIHDNGGSGSFDGIEFTSSNPPAFCTITGNSITDTAGSGDAMRIAGANNYLANNTFSGTGASTISDVGTQTIYANQQTNSSNDLAIRTPRYLGVGTTSPNALLHVSGGTVGGNAALIVDQTGSSSNDIFTASASGTTRFRIDNSGNIIGAGTLTGLTGLTSSGTITFSGFSTDGGLLYTNGSGVLAQLGTGTTGQCLLSNTGAAPSWGSCDGASSVNVWELAEGTARTTNQTVDLLVGGTSTASAKFAVLNVGNGIPTASISAGTSGGLYITANGTLTTTARQSLNIGSSASVGNINLIGGTPATGNVNGFGINLTAGAASGVSSTGGSVNITSGAGSGSIGSLPGPINITGGANPGNGAGGAVNITAGAGGTAGTGGALVLAGGAAGSSAGSTGGAVSITGGSNPGNGAGGAVNITGGAGRTAGASGNVNITGGTTSNPSPGTTAGGVYLVGGAGQAAGGAGGVISLITGAGASSTTPGPSGTLTLATGAGGNSTFFGGSASGAISIYTGGAGTANNGAGGNAGAISLTGGNGSAGTGSNAGGAGGSLTLTGGNGGSTSTGTGGSAGTIALVGGDAGTPSGAGTGVVGGAISLTGGTGSLALAGGALNFTAGQGGATGAGGAISLTTGAGGATSGSSGALTLGTGAVTSGSFGTISLKQGSNTRLYVDSVGNLGIGTTSPIAPLHITGGNGSNAAFVLNQTNDADIFTASSSGTTRFRIDNSGNIIGSGTLTGLTGLTSSGTITFSGFSTDGGLLYTNGSGVLAQLGTGSTGQCLLSNTGAAPSWGSCDGAGSVNVWDSGAGIITQGNTTQDLLIGGVSTSSAKFAFLNVNPGSGDPTLRIYNSNSSQYLDIYHDGTNGHITSSTGTVNIGDGTGSIYLEDELVNDTANNNGFLQIQDKLFVQSTEDGIALAVFDNTGTGDIFTASSSGTTRFTISSSGNIVSSAGISWQPSSDSTTALNIANSAGTSFVTFDTSNTRVGIGLNSPQFKLDLTDSQASTVSALFTNTSTNSDADVLALKIGATTAGTNNNFATFLNGVGEIIGKITGNGSGGVTYSTTGIDFAEYYKKENASETFAAGDLVCLGSTGGITKCAEDQTSILGIVSDQAGFVGGSNHSNDPSYVLVGIVGQLEVKVTGNVKPGDKLAASSFPGVAKVADTTGYVVGRALASHNSSEVGKVMVALGVMYAFPDMAIDTNGNINGAENTPDDVFDAIEESETDELVEYGPSENPIEIEEASTSAKLSMLEEDMNTLLSEFEAMQERLSQMEQSSLTLTPFASSSGLITSAENLLVYGTSTFNDVSIKTLTIGTSMKITSNSIDTIGETLALQSLKQGTLSIMNDAVIVETDGTLRVNENAIFAKDVEVQGVLSASSINALGEELSVSGSARFENASFETFEVEINNGTERISNTLVRNDDSAGKVILKAGETEVTVLNEKVTEGSLIFITPNTYIPAQSLYVDEQIGSTSFTVKLPEAIEYDIEFNFLIVN